eukprot:6385-Eustigmatos_ZCMA.PRE.1
MIQKQNTATKRRVSSLDGEDRTDLDTAGLCVCLLQLGAGYSEGRGEGGEPSIDTYLPVLPVGFHCMADL